MLALLCCSPVVHQTMAAIDSYQPCMRWVGSLTIVFFEVRLVQDLGMQSSWSWPIDTIAAVLGLTIRERLVSRMILQR